MVVRCGRGSVTLDTDEAFIDTPRMTDRRNEWFVPRFGPERFRIAIGLLFLPYTGMVLAFTVIGAMAAPNIDWRRVAALLVIYFLALGIGAHALDAIGSKAVKPWGDRFSPRALWRVGIGALIAAYAICIYYMLVYSPLLWPIAIVEGFLLLAYNLEWFGGWFHTDKWFVFSWGVLPTLAGYVLQTNSLSPVAVALALGTGIVSYVEIRTSRPYKALKRLAQPGQDQRAEIKRYERILKFVSLGTIAFGAGLAFWRWTA